MSALRKTFYSLAAAVLFGVFVAGCGGGYAGTNPPPPPPPTGHEVLFVDSATGIQAYSIDNGTLTALASTPDSDLSRFITGNMLVTGSGKFLLVTDSSGTNIKVFSINQSTGGLTPVTGSPFAIGGAGGGSLAMDSSGKYLYASYLTGVAAFSFNNSTGTLIPVTNSPFSDGSSPFAGAVDPLWKVLLHDRQHRPDWPLSLCAQFRDRCTHTSSGVTFRNAVEHGALQPCGRPCGWHGLCDCSQ